MIDAPAPAPAPVPVTGLRVRYKPAREERRALRAELVRLQQPAAALELLRSVLPVDFEPAEVVCTPQSAHPDRFVLRVQVRSPAGEERGYALKRYSDDFGQVVWLHAQALAAQHRPDGGGLCLPSCYLHRERTLVFPWVDGAFLSDIVDERRPELTRRAAAVAASLHRVTGVAGPATGADVMVAETLARCARLRDRWPETLPLVEPLMTALAAGMAALDPADLAPIHGDMSPGQFLWTGDRLVLLDLDLFGYADPAYDAGHFLAQMERRCLLDPTLPAEAWQWLDCFRDAYLAAMPHVSPRNVWFYRGLTLIRKIYTICRRDPAGGPRIVPPLAARARAALEQAAAPGGGRTR